MAYWLTDILYRAEYQAERQILVLKPRWRWIRLPDMDAKVGKGRVLGQGVLTTPYRMAK